MPCRASSSSVSIWSRERLAFSRALHLDEAAAARHHDVHVGLARRVLGIVEVEQRHALEHADARPAATKSSTGCVSIIPRPRSQRIAS